jgi:hypothetical protein
VNAACQANLPCDFGHACHVFGGSVKGPEILVIGFRKVCSVCDGNVFCLKL